MACKPETARPARETVSSLRNRLTDTRRELSHAYDLMRIERNRAEIAEAKLKSVAALLRGTTKLIETTVSEQRVTAWADALPFDEDVPF